MSNTNWGQSVELAKAVRTRVAAVSARIEESDRMNSTSSKSSPPYHYYFYIGQGLLILLLNVLIILAICRKSKLRQHYTIVAALAVADAGLGAAYFSAGAYRTWLISEGLHTVKVGTFSCMLNVHTILLIFFTPLASLMLVCVSVDRLVGAGFSMWYFKYKEKFTKRLIAAFYLISFLNSMFLVLLSFVRRNDPKYSYSKICLASQAIGKGWASKYYFFLRFGSGTISVFLYLLIPVLTAGAVQATTNLNDKAQMRKAKRQKKLMKTLAYSAFFTFVFFVIPNVVKAYLVGWVPPDLWGLIAPYLNGIQNMNPLMNFVLYTLRHEDLRRAILGLFSKRLGGPTNTAVTTNAGRSMARSKANPVASQPPKPKVAWA